MGDEIADYGGDQPFSQWCMDAYAISLDVYREIKLAYRQGGMKRTMPIFPGAKELCHSVKEHGAELWMTTTRPYLSLDNIIPDTVEWLHRHDIQYDGMLFDEDKYAQLAKRIDHGRVVLILDDLHEMCMAAGELFPGRIVQIAGIYNFLAPYTVASSLVSAKTIAATRIEEWRVPHD
jgi:phosphoglycolate phosphatase-like HAD superfamily hydrolase